MRLPDSDVSRIPLRMWHAAVSRSAIGKSARVFAEMLYPLTARTGRIRATPAAELGRRYAELRDRKTITGRRVRQLIAELRAAGLLDRLGRPAPGRPARYGVLVPGTDLPRPMIIRPRGVAPKRLHASFVAELHAPGPP